MKTLEKKNEKKAEKKKPEKKIVEKKSKKKRTEEKKVEKKVLKDTNIIETKISSPKRTKKQRAVAEKRARLAVKARQTKWAPVWVVLKKYGSGKKMHPSAVTVYKRSWRRTKLHIKPRKIRKSHMG